MVCGGSICVWKEEESVSLFTALAIYLLGERVGRVHLHRGRVDQRRCSEAMNSSSCCNICHVYWCWCRLWKLYLIWFVSPTFKFAPQRDLDEPDSKLLLHLRVQVGFSLPWQVSPIARVTSVKSSLGIFTTMSANLTTSMLATSAAILSTSMSITPITVFNIIFISIIDRQSHISKVSSISR